MRHSPDPGSPGALAALALLVAGCGPAEPPLRTVEQILAQCDSFKGKMVRAAGYLGECGGYECRLYPDEAGEKAFFEALRQDREEVRLANSGIKPARGTRVREQPPYIGIGGGVDFDRKAARFTDSHVVVTGRVAADTCSGAGGTDRSPGIEPTDIRAWRPSEGAPTNIH